MYRWQPIQSVHGRYSEHTIHLRSRTATIQYMDSCRPRRHVHEHLVTRLQISIFYCLSLRLFGGLIFSIVFKYLIDVLFRQLIFINDDFKFE